MRTTCGIAYDRAGPSDAPTVVLLHAGVADRRMWEPQWRAFTGEFDVIRLDFRGFGDSAHPPDGALAHTRDVVASLDELEVEHAHLIGASLGAGVAVEVALLRPELAASLLLVGPGGSLIREVSDELRTIWRAEIDALERGDIDAAVEANVRGWVDGPHRLSGSAPVTARTLVAEMQRRAFDITADWDVDEEELEPPPPERLHEVLAPTTILVGDADVDVIRDAAAHSAATITDASLETWPGVAHMPSLERPDDFRDLALAWLAQNRSP